MTAQSQAESRRLEERYDATGVTAEINGKSYTLRDWSARGMALADYDCEHERGERIRAKVSAGPAYDDATFETGLFVVRADPSIGLLAAVFIEYDRETALLLDRLFPVDD